MDRKPKTGPPPPSGQKPKTGPPPKNDTPEYRNRQERVAIRKARIALSEESYGIKVITSGLNERYEIIDSVFAMDSHAGGFLSAANPEKAFVGVKKQLAQKAIEIGGNAVINCSFE